MAIGHEYARLNRNLMIAAVIGAILLTSFGLTFAAASASAENESLFKSWRSLIAPILDLQNRVDELEERNAFLEQRVEELEERIGPDNPPRLDDYFLQIDDHVFDTGDGVVITGAVADVSEEIDEVSIKVMSPDGTEIDAATVPVDEDDGSFDYLHSISDNPDEGVYTVWARYGDWQEYSYFIVDVEDDTVVVELDNHEYEPGDEVTITGTIDNPIEGEEDIQVTVLDPNNDILLELIPIDGDEFEYSFDLDDDAELGRYAVIVDYAGGQSGAALFDVMQ
jgi:uncharacterized protein YfaS (alpha-2-macroglobulin family)